MPKTLHNTFLFNQYVKYQEDIIKFIVEGEHVDTKADAFQDIIYDVKRRQVSSSLAKVLQSPNCVLIINSRPMIKALKVFAAKDIKGDRKLKVFIDVTGVIEFSEGKYICNNIDILIAHLMSAMTTLIYYADSKRLLMNNEINTQTAYCFALMFSNIIDYIAKISTVTNLKQQCMYLSAMYCYVNLLEKDEDNESVRHTARKIAGISETEEEIIRIQVPNEGYTNIKFFIETIANILKIDKLNLSLFSEKWLYLYGTGTEFALELLPAFFNVISNAYVGCYINNQKTIEKVTDKHMVMLTKALIMVGAESV